MMEKEKAIEEADEEVEDEEVERDLGTESRGLYFFSSPTFYSSLLTIP